MVFESILNPRRKTKEHYKSCSMPLCFMDLNLDVLLNEIKMHCKGYEIQQYFYELPRQTASIRYRQGVCRDLENPAIWNGVMKFCEDMSRARKYGRNSDESTMQLQKECWCMNSAFFYCTSIRNLFMSLKEGKPIGAGFQSMVFWLEELLSSEKFVQFEEVTKQLMEKFSKINYSIVIEEDKIWLSREVAEGLWENQLPNMENPYGSILKLSRLEEIALSMLEKSNQEEFKEFHSYYDTYHEFMDEKLVAFEEEIQFYIGYLSLIRKMQEEGYAFSYPEIVEEKFDVKECYDLVLARKNRMEGLGVVSNSIAYQENEKFFVITGPNQGGKTTFARAMGQVVYLAMLGLKIPAESAKVPFFNDVVTHFATEESVETGSGKLKEELDRLAPLMHNNSLHNFVLINELFTTATTYDAMIMGERVMKHFMSENCQGIYVTHIQELAEEKDGVVSLVASVDEKDSHLRTYKMLRKQPEGIGYASDIVSKYHLTYEELKTRLSGKGGNLC